MGWMRANASFHIRNNNCTSLPWARAHSHSVFLLPLSLRNERRRRSLLELFLKNCFWEVFPRSGWLEWGWNASCLRFSRIASLQSPIGERCWFDERKMVTQKEKFHRLSMGAGAFFCSMNRGRWSAKACRGARSCLQFSTNNPFSTKVNLVLCSIAIYTRHAQVTHL